MKLKPAIRKKVILKEIEKNKEVSILELSKALDVSEMTIRRDLKKLEGSGKLLRTYKGAVPVVSINDNNLDDALKARMMKNREEKCIIAKYANELVDNEDVIMIDASTTALALCKYIRNKKIIVVTNSISVVTALANYQNVTVIVVSGILRNESLSLVGTDTVKGFKKFNIKKCFISAKALSFEYGLTDINIFEIETKKAAMAVSKEVIVLVDHSKLNNVSLLKVCDYKDMNKIIVDGMEEFTDRQFELLKQYRENNVEVIVAK
ncbi:DeoR/GlpR family DNA-binding transcription regulator [Clostridium sp. AWRP]|uniref:DeoR/GlpR family DNA-binding transcription regulator n=1 Tax=Clostridium sp. AWRP TaxID=2212991 RepID=UPI000FD7AF44|nr:DeoR/GlpR family DNA-binding transcription regulator [Clostridium sp. AWRP]AZV56521.1 DeoR family transcriptional regulator [Clostridium sp. AWRP]